MEEAKKKNVIILGLTFVFLSALLIGVLVLVRKKVVYKQRTGKGKKMSSVFNKTVKKIPANSPYITLTTVKNRVKTGESIEVYARFNSKTEKVTGFDVVVHYNPKLVSYSQTESLDPSFKLSIFKRPDYVVITGTKSLKNTPSVVKGRIAKIEFVAKEKGKAKFEVEERWGKEHSQVVNASSHVFDIPKTDKVVEIY